MATWTDVTRIMKGISAAVRTPAKREWKVTKKLAVWERPLRQSDLAALGAKAPKGDVLGVYVPLEVKDALIARGGPYFTTPHFDGYPYVLVELKKVKPTELKRLAVSSCEERGAKRRK